MVDQPVHHAWAPITNLSDNDLAAGQQRTPSAHVDVERAPRATFRTPGGGVQRAPQPGVGDRNRHHRADLHTRRGHDPPDDRARHRCLAHRPRRQRPLAGTHRRHHRGPSRGSRVALRGGPRSASAVDVLRQRVAPPHDPQAGLRRGRRHVRTRHEKSSSAMALTSSAPTTPPATTGRPTSTALPSTSPPSWTG